MYVGGGGRDDRAFIQSTLMGTNKTVSVCAKAAQQVFYYCCYDRNCRDEDA